MTSRSAPPGARSTRTGRPSVEARAIAGMKAPGRCDAAPSSSGAGRSFGSVFGSWLTRKPTNPRRTLTTADLVPQDLIQQLARQAHLADMLAHVLEGMKERP